jgi:hypothetical protein
VEGIVVVDTERTASTGVDERVSCVTSTHCTVVGGTTHGKILIEVWDGSDLTVQPSLSP